MFLPEARTSISIRMLVLTALAGFGCVHAPQRKILDRLIARQGRVLLDDAVGAWQQCIQNSKAESVFFNMGSRGIFGVTPRSSMQIAVRVGGFAAAAPHQCF